MGPKPLFLFFIQIFINKVSNFLENYVYFIFSISTFSVFQASDGKRRNIKYNMLSLPMIPLPNIEYVVDL